jgi:hypothetical protein
MNWSYFVVQNIDSDLCYIGLIELPDIPDVLSTSTQIRIEHKVQKHLFKFNTL